MLAAREAAKRGLPVISLTGSSGGTLAGEVHIPLRVPTDSTARIQEIHILQAHIMCDLVEAQVFEDLTSAAGR